MAIDARPPTADDGELIAEAEATLREHHVPDKRRVASALRGGSGATYATANLETGVGNAVVHCEPITVANALDAGETTVETTVAVLFPGDDGPVKAPVEELLPGKG